MAGIDEGGASSLQAGKAARRYFYFEIIAYHYADDLARSSGGDEMIGTTTIALKKVSFSVPDSVEFRLDYRKPGTKVVSRTTSEALKFPGKQISHVVAADGGLLREN